MRNQWSVSLVAVMVLALASCGNKNQQSSDKERASSSAPSQVAPSEPVKAKTAPDFPRGLLLALSQFEVGADGKALPKPKAARLEIVTREGGKWRTQAFEDAESNVFHKALVYAGDGKAPGILTLGGTEAAVKLWRREPDNQFHAATYWKQNFGGKFNRMRDAETADVYGDGQSSIVVATHDQGVVAILRPKKGESGAVDVTQLDHRKDTFVHEIEIGDLDGDHVLEVYATPSEPNQLEGKAQKGEVVRYIPAKKQGRAVVASLGNRHAKEILVTDLDGDGRDELYVSVEAETEGQGDELRIKEPVEIRRYDAGQDPKSGTVVARIDDRLCRFLTAGDVDGDGKKELVAAAFRSGVWLLRPRSDRNAAFSVESIERNSSGFEHAALLTDLDGDKRDELYVASDDQGELRRYTWNGKGFDKEVIFKRPVPDAVFTWNLMPVPVSLVR